MSRKYSSFIVALAWCCSLFATPMFTLAADSDNQGRGGRKPVKVMTRNLYLGADLLPVVSSPTLNHLLANAAATFARVEATDFPARAKLLAREICDTEPALIGLQEVALWRRGDFGVLDGPGTPATIVLYDFLQSLQSELNALGLEYSVVVAQSEFDAEVPSALGFDLRVTLRDVILARADLSPNKLSLTNPQSANYLTTFVLMTIAGPITLRRGWTSVDATMKGRSFRFINTHLESFDPQLRFGQSFELLGGPANTTLPVVLVGDLNSGPAEAG
ncbi:MAG: hypothetical protein ACRD9R_21440, partial [Pyrinomonadaceae bacterium]